MTAMTKTRTYRDPGVCNKNTDPSPPVTDWQPRAKALIFNRLLYNKQEYVMLANAQMTKEQLGRETVEEYLHQASMMLQSQEVKKGMYLASRERHGMTLTKQAT